MVSSRADRTRSREPRATAEFGRAAGAALQVFELLELAWHDCYRELTPPDQVIEDVWAVADGRLGDLVSAAHLAVLDWRDLRMSADTRRSGR